MKLCNIIIFLKGFGAAACDGPGIGDYQVAIPTNLLFNGARVPND
ncbi:10946_t:CDS:2, partial [Funneliformis caledonium]